MGQLERIEKKIEYILQQMVFKWMCSTCDGKGTVWNICQYSECYNCNGLGVVKDKEDE